jgi:hypothetical protein
MIIVVIIFFGVLGAVSILCGFSYIIKDYSEEEKKECWERFFNGFNGIQK